jgi:hypothetical protein
MYHRDDQMSRRSRASSSTAAPTRQWRPAANRSTAPRYNQDAPFGWNRWRLNLGRSVTLFDDEDHAFGAGSAARPRAADLLHAGGGVRAITEDTIEGGSQSAGLPRWLP